MSNTTDYSNYITITTTPSYTSGTTTWASTTAATTTWVTQPEVVNWGGKIYLNPSAKLRVLMDAIRLL